VQSRIVSSAGATPKQKFSLNHTYEVSNADGQEKWKVVLREFLSTGSRLIRASMESG